VIELLSLFAMAVGVLCSTVGALGLLRFPDIYTRLHANTVLVVGGVIVLLIGAALSANSPPLSIKILLIAAFIFVTNPVGAHAIARAAHRSGVPLWRGSVCDALQGETKWKR
jgi:multicomponent Na+:H+ antiporter subunit G